MRATLAIAVMAATTFGVCAAMAFEGLRPDEISAVTRLSAAYARSIVCDRPLNHANARIFLEKELGAGRAYNAGAIVDAMFAVAGTMGIHTTIVSATSPRRRAEAIKRLCDEAVLAYGPNGTAIPGLWK